MLNNLLNFRTNTRILLCIGFLFAFGCQKKKPDQQVQKPMSCSDEACSAQPCVIETESSNNQGEKQEIAQDGPNSSVSSSNGADQQAGIIYGKQLWAKSYLYQKPPEFVVEKWIRQPPQREGKVVLIEFWGTWCSQCIKAIDTLNLFHEKFGDELVVIGISDETEETVRSLDKKIHYYHAIDTQGRMQETLGVVGFPHIIILEPGGCVVWEGFPYQENYELTDEIIEKILKIAREN